MNISVYQMVDADFVLMSMFFYNMKHDLLIKALPLRHRNRQDNYYLTQ